MKKVHKIEFGLILFFPNKMSTMTFDQYALRVWIEMCNKEKKRREEGASQEELHRLHVCVTAGMVNLLPNLSDLEKDRLLEFLLNSPTDPVVQEEVGDPLDCS